MPEYIKFNHAEKIALETIFYCSRDIITLIHSYCSINQLLALSVMNRMIFCGYLHHIHDH